MSNSHIKTGTYAIRTSYSTPWTKKKKPTKSRRRNTELKIVHELFLKASEETTDPYWKSIFIDCSKDRFPRFFSYRNLMLIFRKKNKLERIVISDFPSESFTQCTEFFKKHAGLMSKIDIELFIKDEHYKNSLKTEDITWKSIKTAKVKDILVTDYVNSIAKNENFDIIKKNDLMTTVKRGIMLKHFKPENIILENGKISSIGGLLYDKDADEYYIDPDILKKRPGRKVNGLGMQKNNKNNTVSFLDVWEKYLTKLENEKSDNINLKSSLSSSSSNSQSDDLYSPLLSDTLSSSL